MSFQQKLQRWQFTSKLQQSFLEDLTALIADGVPVNRSVETIERLSTGVTRNVAQGISSSIARGQLLADGMQGWFANSIVEIVRAGENSGSLIETLQRASTSLSKQTNAIATIISSMLYPLVVIVGALGMLVFIKNSVLESFIAIKPLNQWSETGQNIYHFAVFIQGWWWFLILLILAIIVTIAVVLRHLTGDLRRLIDKVPLLSLYRELIAARFMETLGLLLQNGVALNRSLQILQKNAQPYFAWHLAMMEIRLSAGQDNIADVLDTGLLDEGDLVRLQVIAKGKGFEGALLSLGAKATQRVAAKLAKAGKIGGGILLAIGALLAASMILGIYTVGSTIAN